MATSAMATTTLQSRSSNILVPSIHLGSFSPYPKMSNDIIQFPEDNTVPVFRDDMSSPYPPPPPPPPSQSRTPSHWRPNPAPYPQNQSFPYNSFPANRPSYTSTTTMPRTPSRSPPPTSSFYPNVLQPSPSVVPVQPPNSPAQLSGPPREVCIECMMRDEDMADVDVTGPGVWDRESDVHYHELCAREEQARDRDISRHPSSSSSAASSSTNESRPRAKGTILTEGNLKVWLTLNPREPAAKHQTLHAYLNAQHELLAAEAKARIQAMKESRQLDDKMRDAYSQLRRSAYDLGATVDDGGVKIHSPSIDDTNHNRDTTLLENGMIVERMDMRKEEARMRKEERRARKASRDSLSAIDNRDAASLYSFRAAEGPASLKTPAPFDSAASVPLPTSRSVRSMFTTPSASWQPPITNRPMSMAPASGSVPAFSSQTSLESSGSPRRRFFGFRHLSGYFSSNTTLAPSGSMVDMHLGLDQEKNLAQTPHVDIGSNAPSLREAWPRMEDKKSPDLSAADQASTTRSKKKKRRGLGRLWKIMTGSQAQGKAQEVQSSELGPPHEVEDEDLPLAPPPPLSYLVNRSSAQSERSIGMGSGRHLSLPSLTSLSPQHPRSSSAPSGVGLSFSSPSEKSSTLPSPTEVRLSFRDSSGDEPEEEDALGEGALKQTGTGGGGSPTRPFIVNMSEPDIRRSSPVHAFTSSSPPPPPRHGPPSSSSLTPTVKVIPGRPPSVMSLDKNLPPLPPSERGVSPVNHAHVHATLPPLAGYRQQTLPASSSSSKQAFRHEDAVDRRQSFGGLASRPALPRGARAANGPSRAAYDDFGSSRHSLAVLERAPIAKRRSRFGLGALLGRKERKSEQQQQQQQQGQRSRDVQGLPRGFSYDPFVGHAVAPSLSMSERSLPSPLQSLPLHRAGPVRRPLEDVVQQDADFVAYRYPSRDERLNLSRG